MKPNIGSLDRLVRLLVGLALLVVGYVYHNWWGLLGLLPILTALVRFCPAYVPFGLSTCATKKEPEPPAPS